MQSLIIWERHLGKMYKIRGEPLNIDGLGAKGGRLKDNFCDEFHA